MYTETGVMVTSLLLGGLKPTLPGLSGLFFVCTCLLLDRNLSVFYKILYTFLRYVHAGGSMYTRSAVYVLRVWGWVLYKI